MSPERKPPNGELGGFTTADIAAAIAIESAEMLERVLRRLEMRDACDENRRQWQGKPRRRRQAVIFRLKSRGAAAKTVSFDASPFSQK